MTSKQEKIAQTIIKELRKSDSGFFNLKRIAELIKPFYIGGDETKMYAESVFLITSLTKDYGLIREESKCYVLTSKGKSFKTFRKERNKIRWEYVRKHITFWMAIIAFGLSTYTFLMNNSSNQDVSNRLDGLNKRIEKIERDGKYRRNAVAPILQEIDSISEPFETQQNQGVQEK